MRRTAMLAVILLPIVAACSDDNPVAPPVPEVDAALIGVWIGPIEFSEESWTTTMTMNLHADGSMSVSLEGYPAADVDGTWGVLEDEFSAGGTSENDGATNWVSFSAPRSATQMMGTWLAAPCPDSCDGDAVGGLFVITKR